VEGAKSYERNGSAREKFIRQSNARRVFGGRGRYWSLSDCRSLSFIRHGLHFRERIIFGNYISPFYSPELFGGSPYCWPGAAGVVASTVYFPSVAGARAPGGFRLTCYYYRGVLKRLGDLPACTIGEPRETYLGERSFPRSPRRTSTAIFFILR
jgi:hypothetical protein